MPTLAVPVQPLLEGSNRPYSMYRDHWKYDWVLNVQNYGGPDELVSSLDEMVIRPAEEKLQALMVKRTRAS